MSTPGQEFREVEYLGMGLLAVTSAGLIDRLLAGQQIDEDDKHTLMRAQKFLNDVASGAKLVNSGVSSNISAVESVRKLSYSVEPLQLIQDNMKAADVESVLERVAATLGQSLQSGVVAAQRADLTMAKSFFNALQRFLLNLVETDKRRTAERVNDFATPCFINLLCRVVLFQSVSFPLAVG